MLTNSFALLGGLLLAALLVWKEFRGLRRPWVMLFRAALAGWAAVFVGLALFPLPVSPSAIEILRAGVEGPPRVNLIPFASVVAAMTGDAGPQQPSFIVGNVVAFIPLGILGPLLLSRLRHWSSVLVLGFLVSLLTESVQWLGSLGYGFAWKSFDVDDLVLNTIGTVVGFAAYRLVLGRDLERLVEPPLAARGIGRQGAQEIGSGTGK